jgi:hypothetical protein
MANTYIDYCEITEYSDHFVERSRSLVGASPLVDVDHMRMLVSEAAARVGAELDKIGLRGSDLRSGRVGMGMAADAARKDLRRFFYYLISLDETVILDREAFFPGYRLGELKHLVPVELGARLDQIRAAFALPTNQALPRREAWQARLSATQNALFDALAREGGTGRLPQQSLAGLRKARAEFLHLYDGVAKPLLRALLGALGRDHEYQLYFADLQADASSSLSRQVLDARPGEVSPPAFE